MRLETGGAPCSLLSSGLQIWEGSFLSQGQFVALRVV